MAIRKDKKKLIIEKYINYIDSSESLFFIDTQGLDIKTINILKEELIPNSAKYILIKNTLFRKALKGSSGYVENIDKGLFGYNALVFSESDSNIIAKKILDFGSKNDVEIKFGSLYGSFLSKEDIIGLSKVPSKEQSIVNIIYIINGGLQRLHFVLNYNIQMLINTINIIKESKEVK